LRLFAGLSALLFLAITIPPGEAASSSLPDNVWSGEPTKPQNGLPDGHYALYRDDGQIVAAWYGSPTRRYRHGILGDAIEAGSLHVAVKNGGTYELTLPEIEVFEDRTPRIVDLDGDGAVEIITIRAYLDAGASVAIFGLRDGRLVELAATAPIGIPNRWLNIAGIADYAGRGKPQIAYVETPHIGGTLYFVEWQGRSLAPIASVAGFSNHKIGAREQDLSADLDFNGDGKTDIVVPSNDRRTLRVVGLRNGRAEELHRATFRSPVKSAKRSGNSSSTGCVQMLLEDRKVAEVCPSG